MFIDKKFSKLESRIDAKLKSKVPFYGKEKYCQYGNKNREKEFMVIRRNDSCGLGSYIVTNVRYICSAIENNMIPVIDMQNYNNAYNTKENIHKDNVWEYYFEQPFSQYSLKEVYESKNVLLTNIRIFPAKTGEPDMEMDFLANKAQIRKYRNIVKKYIRLNQKTYNFIMTEYRRIISPSDYVLGCVLRGTDYTSMKPKNHPIQPSVEDAANYCEEIMKQRNCTKLFLATEDERIYRYFKGKFGERLIINNKLFVNYQGGGINEYEFDRENDGFMRGLEYLTTMYILSLCNCLVAGRCGASVVATIMANDFDYSYYWDLGVY